MCMCAECAVKVMRFLVLCTWQIRAHWDLVRMGRQRETSLARTRMYVELKINRRQTNHVSKTLALQTLKALLLEGHEYVY